MTSTPWPDDVMASDSKLIIRGLVGTRHRNLYLNEAQFHAVVSVLAPLILAWMDKLAEQAKVRQVDYEVEVRRLMGAV